MTRNQGYLSEGFHTQFEGAVGKKGAHDATCNIGGLANYMKLMYLRSCI